MAQFERRLIQERTKAGLAAARARGRHGVRPKLMANDAKVILAKKLYKDHSLDIDDICQTLRISRSTYYRYVRMKPQEAEREGGSDDTQDFQNRGGSRE